MKHVATIYIENKKLDENPGSVYSMAVVPGATENAIKGVS